ncbi:uncharacterized protein LOC110451631 [Mizuhopecten yessoensis]|uniref:uncharacterized protein LOC110451631 n=1 Tax=Mizuhopecten yessoensis TaxID=6573 RepID=UPI000B45CE93|nr:uncharacterized protein LOC110451631 [Mizuhopecten yessoensis]
MADNLSPPTFRKHEGDSGGKFQNEKPQPGSTQNQANEDFSVERTCTMVKVKIEKLEDEEKEKMSFYPKGNSILIHYLCKHDLANLAAEQGSNLILENRDQKLVVKLLIKKEIPIENYRDKVRELIVKTLPNLHQEKCYLSSLSNKEPASNKDQGYKDPLQQALACLVPLIKAGQNQADVLYDKDLNCLIITGPTETVKQLHVEAKVKLYSVTMETVLESPSQGCLLRTFRVMDQLIAQYHGLTAVVRDCNTKVTWTGTEENIRQGRQEMEKFIREIKTDTFYVSMVMKKLLLTPEIKHYIDSILQKDGITCVWQVIETGQVQVWSMKASSSKRVGLKIRENFKEEAFLVKDFPFISDVSKVGFGLGTAEMNNFSVEETSDTVHVAAKSGTMQKIIQYLQDLEDKPTPGKQPSANQEGDNSEKTTSGCTIEVRGMDKLTSNDTVELYFESKRAVGHPVDIENFDASKREKDGVIFITYENEEDAQLVLGRQHTLDKSSLTVRLFEALEPVAGLLFYKEKVFFRNMNPTTTRKVLENFLKSKVNVSPLELLYGEEEGAVLVTFDGDPDFEKLKNACQNSTLENCLLEAMQVPISHSVLVSGVGKGTSLDTLEFYFENSRRSGGSDVTEVKEISDGYFHVTFEDPGVIDRVCQRTHKLDRKTLTVQTYHEMLGHRVSHTGPTFKVPCPLVIKDADQNKVQHLMSYDMTKLEKQLSDHHAKLHWPGDIPGHLKLECLLTEDVVDGNRLVISWEEVVRNILSNFLAQAGTTKAQVAVRSPDVTGSTKDSSAIAKKDRDLNKVDYTRDHFSSPHDDSEYVPDISIVMPKETFLALQFFCCRDGKMDQQAVCYRGGMLQVSFKERSDKKAMQINIESKLKHLEIMNKDDVSFTPAEEPNVKGTIEQIHKSVDGVFCYQLEKDEHSMVHLMAQSYGQLQTAKHKISLGLGRLKQTETKRNRRFDNTPLQQNKGDSTSTDRHRFSQSFTASQSPWQSQSISGYGSVSPKDFTTPEGLLVRVYPGSILRLDVDCIVNAANGDLQHGGGVAYVISNAAGYDFEREGRDYIARYGPLRVGEVCTTTAGNLKYKGVIHSVGPRWYDYGQDQKQICLEDLKTAVKNSLEEADFQQYKSIAIPAISSGIFSVPKEHCTQQYYRAVEEYSKSRRSRSTLTEVHFIDKDTQMCDLIQTTFTKCFAGNAGSSSYGAGTGGGSNFSSSVMSLRKTTPVLQRFRSVSADGDGSSVDPASPSCIDKHMNFQRSTSSGLRFKYQIGNNWIAHIVHGNIVEIEADAIVSPENVQCDSTGSIAREIARVAGQDIDKDQSELKLIRRKPKLTEVLETLAGRSHFKYVLHVVAPKWDVTAVADQSSYWMNLEKSYKNIFSNIDEKHLDITSLALPILGTGAVEKNATPINSICRLIANVCKKYAAKTPSRKTLCFCNDETVAVLALRYAFERVFNKSSDGSEDVKKGHTAPDMTGRTRGAGSEVTENCCICIDTMTDEPKKLSCGHMFCRECIDQQFKYKPACPQCGAVHGKITGDQPPGTMTMTTTKSSRRGGSLPGHEGYGIINISYHFPPGKQGPDHPTPGKYYQGITRPGFLPDNKKGRLVARLLKIAFDRKLVFTIGSSRTTGNDGVVTWNDIHHKTSIDGGPEAYGYPDPSYLDMVLYDLKTKGITKKSLDEQ